jgi:hypothetical protein
MSKAVSIIKILSPDIAQLLCREAEKKVKAVWSLCIAPIL